MKVSYCTFPIMFFLADLSNLFSFTYIANHNQILLGIWEIIHVNFSKFSFLFFVSE